VCLSFDGLKKIDGPSNLGDFHYIPMLFYEGRKVGNPKTPSGFLGLFLSRIQGRAPEIGLIWHGRQL